MDEFIFDIDEKSLFYGIKNDYKKGESATVSTPLNQSSDPAGWKKDILKLENIENKYNSEKLPVLLLKKCLSNTTSQAKSKIDSFYNFENIWLDNEKLECDSSFAMYIKEETNDFITNKENKLVPNSHKGRKKLHYLTSLKYKDSDFNIDNKKVLENIIKQNGGFAFVVNGFKYNPQNNRLTFLTTLVGEEGVALSSIFKIKKGTGKKLKISPDRIKLDKESENLLKEISSQNDSVIAKNFRDSLEKRAKTSYENGLNGEKFILDYLKKHIKGIEHIRHVSLEYPTAPYDIEYILDGEKHYVEVKATQGCKKEFFMSHSEQKFMGKYIDNYILYLVTNIKDSDKKIITYEYDNILKLKKEYPSTHFFG